MRLPRAATSFTACNVLKAAAEQLMANIEANERSRNRQTAEGLLQRSWQTIGTDKRCSALVEFSDVAGSVVDVATANQRATDVDNHLRSVSYDQFGFGTKDVVPNIIKVGTTASYTSQDSTSNPTAGASALAEDILNKAALPENGGYNYANYDFIVIAFKGNGANDTVEEWSWAGLGTIGAVSNDIPAISWLNGFDMDSRIFAHEIGHNLGLWHGDAWEAPTTSSQPDDPTGEFQSYGNYYDTMGLTWIYSLEQLQFSAHFKNLLGWIPNEQIQTTTGNFTGRIYASDQTKVSGRHYGLRIDANRSLGTKNGLDYYIEYRSRFTDAAIQNGGLIYLSDPHGSDESTFLLDMVPGTESFPYYSKQNPNNQFTHDHALQVGQSFTDSNNRWRIQITGKGGSGADAYVDVQVTDLLSPQITSQPTATQSANAGTNITPSVGASGSSSPINGRNKMPTALG